MDRTFAKVFGLGFIVFGVLGLFSGSMTMSTGMEIGIFPVNLIHNLVHILIGIWGLAAARSAADATAYCKQVGLLFLLFAIVGSLTSIANGFAGFIPIGGNDRWLHLGLAVVLLYVGYMGEKAAGSMATV